MEDLSKYKRLMDRNNGLVVYDKANPHRIQGDTSDLIGFSATDDGTAANTAGASSSAATPADDTLGGSTAASAAGLEAGTSKAEPYGQRRFSASERKPAVGPVDGNDPGNGDSIDEEEEIGSKQGLSHRANHFAVFLPELNLACTAEQYTAIYETVTELIVFIDPEKAAYMDHLNTILLGMDMGDLRGLLAVIRATQQALRERLPIIQDWYTIQRSNAVLFRDASRAMAADGTQNTIARTIHLYISKATWHMLENDGQPLCDMTLRWATLKAVTTSDQATHLLSEVHLLYIVNRLPNPMFTDLVGPYVRPKHSKPDFCVEKMIRVRWSELAPVGGISIVERFEVDLFPLRLQFSHDIAQKLINYLYPPQESAAVDIPEPVTRSRRSTFTSLNADGTPSIMISISQSGENRDQVDQMKKRASSNKTFLNIKIGGSTLCISYQGKKTNNITDLRDFEFHAPTLELRNQVESYYELLMQVKKEYMSVVVHHTGALVKEKFRQLHSRKAWNKTSFGPDWEARKLLIDMDRRVEEDMVSCAQGSISDHDGIPPAAPMQFDSGAAALQSVELLSELSPVVVVPPPGEDLVAETVDDDVASISSNKGQAPLSKYMILDPRKLMGKRLPNVLPRNFTRLDVASPGADRNEHSASVPPLGSAAPLVPAKPGSKPMYSAKHVD
ncbi:Protein SABRE, partial [Coemansia sp. RSA 2611]